MPETLYACRTHAARIPTCALRVHPTAPAHACTRLTRGGLRRRQQHRNQPDLEALFTMHPGVLGHLVPALLHLYKDVEYTDRGDQFQSKFSFRKVIAELLEWLLTLPQHHATWKSIGAPRRRPVCRTLCAAPCVRRCACARSISKCARLLRHRVSGHATWDSLGLSRAAIVHACWATHACTPLK
jgi:Ubiquitin elongating factor core